jgi:hypothetical protein
LRAQLYNSSILSSSDVTTVPALFGSLTSPLCYFSV